MSGKNIGILTGGGDVPGLNVVIKGVVYRATTDGHNVTGHSFGLERLDRSQLRRSEKRRALCSATDTREHATD